MSDQGNMICPACEKFQPKAEVCTHCGIVIAKAHKPDAPPPRPAKNDSDTDGLPIKAIAVVVIIIIAGGAYLLTGRNQPAEDEQSIAKDSPSQIEKLAVIKPKIANKIQITNTQATLHTLKTKLYMLSMEWAEPPTNEQGLQYLVKQGHLTEAETTDAWGRGFAYKMEWKNENAFTREYEITVHSVGADGLTNTSDDIGMP